MVWCLALCPWGALLLLLVLGYGSPFGVPAVVTGVLAAGGSIRVGCAPYKGRFFIISVTDKVYKMDNSLIFSALDAFTFLLSKKPTPKRGCARGVDTCVQDLVPEPRLVVVSASEFSHLPLSVALAVRTRAVVSGAQCLLAFPCSSGGAW